VSPDFVQGVDRRYYPIGRGLMVPFEPPLLYGVGGKLTFPWFSFWRSNPLAKARLSLFVTIVDELLMDDPDLATAEFQILDFSVPKPRTGEPKPERELRLIDSRDIPRVTNETKLEMLTTFAEGYFLAAKELAATAKPEASDSTAKQHDPAQGDFFEDSPR
jgi:hypothetical protein